MAAAAQQPTPAPGSAGGRQDGKRRRGGDAALRKDQQKLEEEAQAKKEQEERAAANKAYTDVLQPLMFSEQPLERDHYFRWAASTWLCTVLLCAHCVCTWSEHCPSLC